MGLVVCVGVVSFLDVFIVFYIVRRRKLPTNDDEGKPKIMLHMHDDSCQTLFSFLYMLETLSLCDAMVLTISEAASAYSIIG